MNKVTVLSIKPEFSNLIFSGDKKIELRKSKPKIQPGSLILIYNTYPDMAVVGYCKLKQFIELSPARIWSTYSAKLGIDFQRFQEYYDGRKKAVGLEISDVIAFEQPIKLKDIKEVLPEFSPPQTFRYLTKDKLKFLRSKRSTIANAMYHAIG